MKIYKSDGTELTDAVITQDCKTVEEMGKGDTAELKWGSDTKLTLPVGAYFTLNSRKYVLFDAYAPEDTGTSFSYDVTFNAEWMILSRTPFVLYTKDANANDIIETDWTITDKPVNILGYILAQVAIALPCAVDALQWTVETVGKLPASISCSFSSVDIISGLNTIVSACSSEDYETEWCINYDTKTIYFGVCVTIKDVSGVPTLKVDDNVGKPSVSSNTEDYFNRFIVKGSTKNITQRAASGENVSTGVRLTLDPKEYPNGYIDTRTDTNEPILTKALVFDDIYPSLTLYCYNVRERQRYKLDDDGNKVVDHYDSGTPVYKIYSVWYVRLAYPTLDADGNATAWTDFAITDDMVVDGKTLTASFESNEAGTHSALAGREFEMTYHKSAETLGANTATGDTGVVIAAGDYEIVFDDSGDLIIPTTSDLGLIPYGDATKETLTLQSDTVILYNIVMSSDYYAAAYVKLYNAAMEEIESEHSDKNSYTVNSNPVVFEDSTKNPNLYIGMAVTYDDGNGYTLSTRVTKLTTNIDFPFVQEIVVGNGKTKGNIETLKEDVEDASGKITAIISGSADNSKAYYKVLKNKLSKVSDDIAAGKITFEKQSKHEDGLTTGKNFVSVEDDPANAADSGGRIDKEGNAELESLIVRGLATIKNLTVTGAAHFFKLIIDEIKSAGGAYIFTPADGFSADIVTYDSTANKYTLMWKATDGEKNIENKWEIGDQALCQTFNAVEGTSYNAANKLWWCYVSAVGAGKFTSAGVSDEDNGERYNYVTLDWNKRLDNTTDAALPMTNGSIPAVGDNVVMLGHKFVDVQDYESDGTTVTDEAKRRQSAIYVSAYNSIDIGLTAPLQAMYMGIDDYDLSSHRATFFDANSAVFKADRFEIKSGDSYFRVPVDKGAWTSGTAYNYYDRVSYAGSLWLCNKANDGTTAPSDSNGDWIKQVSKGDKGDPGNPGASVAAQYSPDGTTWHTPFVTGDVWMRTSTDGTTWSDAIRIVGENGDNGAYTNYMFAISAHATTSSSTTRPSDIYTWYDAPMAVTAEKPYLWAMVTYIDKNGNAVKTSYIRLTGEQGEQGASAVTLDLTNENDSVIAVGGSIVGTKEITTSARLWNGTYAVYDTGGLDFSSKLAATGCKVAFLYGTCDTYGGLYTFKIYDIDITASEIYADITAVYNNVEYTKRISISVLNGVDKYEIIPSVNAVSYNPTTGTRSTDAITFSIYRTGQTDGTRTEIAITDLPTGYGVYYMKSTATTTKGPLTAASVSISDMTSGNVVLSIKDSNNKVLDSETVPIVSDGKNGDPGSPGSPGTPGTNGITLVMTPDVLEFSTDTDGLVESTELSGDAAKKCVVTMNGSAPSSMEITAVSGCEAVVEGSDNDTIRITKVNTQDIDYTDADGDDATKTVSVSSGYVDFTAVLGTVSVNGRLRFTVSINVLWREIVSTDAEYNLVYTQLQTADGNISTLQKNVSTVTQTASKLTSKVTSVTETANGNKSDIASLKIKADQISLSVETQTNKSNLLTGTAFRRQEEFEWNNGSATNCMIVKNGGYGGTNSIYINSSSTTNGFCGIMFTGLALTISKTYMFSIMVKSPDITAFAGSAYCEVKFYKSDNTEISRVSIVLVPSASNTWETKKLSFTVPALTAYIDMPVFVVSSGQLYICRPMLQEGATYGGWSMSKQDYDYIGGNMLANSRTLTDPSGNSTVPYTETADLTQDGYGVCAVIHSCFSASTTAYKDALAWQDAIALEADTDYIFSAWVKGSGYIELYLYGGNGPISATENSDGVTYSQSDGYSYIKLTSEWRKVWVHWHTAGSLASAKYSLIAARQNYVSGSSNPSQTNASEDVYMACPKLETGATVTDYSESGEDMVSKAQLLATGIDIESGVVRATANHFIVRNQSGDTTFSIDASGNIVGAGDAYFKGCIHADSGYFTGKITATSGTIGGWTISGNNLLSSGSHASLQMVHSDSDFLYVNGKSSSKLMEIRADGKTGINIYTQDTAGICMELMAQTCGNAIISRGNNHFISRAYETTVINGFAFGTAIIPDGTAAGTYTIGAGSIVYTYNNVSYPPNMVISRSTNAITLKLPSDANTGDGKMLLIRKAGDGNITIVPYDSDQKLMNYAHWSGTTTRIQISNGQLQILFYIKAEKLWITHYLD